jgi:DNA-directed RNA polymerase specialized sigma24 family protein
LERTAKQTKKEPFRHRVRSLDLQRIEGQSTARLTGFGQEVLDEIATSADSPLEMVMASEESSSKRNQEIQALRQLRRYLKYARLTPKQKRAYELFTLGRDDQMTLRELSEALKIGVSSAWARVNGAAKRLERIKQRREEGLRLKAILDGVLYAGKLKRVFRLYFERCWPPQMIAKSLHSNLSTIYSNLRTIRRLAGLYSAEK